MRPGLAARAEALLARHWWQARASWLARLLAPLAAIYGRLAERQRRSATPQRAPVPVLVVGNFVVGGAGKSPAVMALVQALASSGHRPGVLSRGYGRSGDGVRAVNEGDAASAVGDEPLLISRRTSVPVWVGRDRIAAARALCAAHPEVDVLVCDDGLQHRALARDAELVVFDDRGAGNGLLLPAGPLRETVPESVPPRMRVLYTGVRQSTALPGPLAQRQLRLAWPLAAWHAGDAGAAVPLADLQGRPLLAAAGLAAPDKFFDMLAQAGLRTQRLPLPDHHAYATLPWPADTPDVLVTEKDAVKLHTADVGRTRVWVVPLDFQLPAALVAELSALLFARHRP
jgi:tetraacyldisaccharide 4'-kinase